MLLILLLTSALAHGAEPLRFALPIACNPGSDCFVQNYVDHDVSSAYRDYACGERTYDGHDGTDFRLRSLVAQRAGVAVLAAADGVVAGVRDGMEDVSIRGTGKDAVKGRECGNGLVLRHADGWETQYCHMAQGSLAVTRGQRVTTGQALGRVGLSGLTEFPHLHFTVRHHGKFVDPFAPEPKTDPCGSGATVWVEATATQLAYRRRVMLNAGFSDRVLSMEEVENHEPERMNLSTESPALVVFVKMIGLEPGDIATLTLRAPDGALLAERRLKPLERAQAQTLALIGRKRPAAGWPDGLYRAEYRVSNDGKTVFEEDIQLRLGPVPRAAPGRSP